MKQKYVEINLRGKARELIEFINTIIDTYKAQGFRLSVRQIYYQLVARDMIANTEQSYKRVAGVINDGRLAGLIDWDMIEDRNRDVVVRSRWGSGAEIVAGCAQQFHMDLWEGQENRVFVVVEKAALAGVLEGVCHKYDVPLLAARGYPSVSIVRDMALQHLAPAMHEGQWPQILHLGDHDPSGIDMTRDLTERLRMFAEAGNYGRSVAIHRLALNMHQIEEINPPPNPAKTTDSRFAEYMRRFGDESWELDALEPRYIVDLVESHIKRYLDADLLDKRQMEIKQVKDKLKGTAAQYADEGI